MLTNSALSERVAAGPKTEKRDKKKRRGERSSKARPPHHRTTLQLASPLKTCISLPPTGTPKLTIKMGDHQPSADELGYHFRVYSGRSREARRDKKFAKWSTLWIPANQWNKASPMLQLQRHSPGLRASRGVIPPTAPVNRDACRRVNPERWCHG